MAPDCRWVEDWKSNPLDMLANDVSLATVLDAEGT